jgi:hypothetical protein
VGAQKQGQVRALLNVSPDLFYQLHKELPFDFDILMLNLSREMTWAFRKVMEDLLDANVRSTTTLMGAGLGVRLHF